VASHPKAEAVYHLAVVQVDDREKVTAALTEAGVGWGLHYPVPCHLDAAYTEFSADARSAGAALGESLPVAERAAERILSLPMSPTLTEQQVARVCDVLGSVGA
jgi:dTDP-4-amino-4,6-dideoxygalactose transaminase